MPLPTDVQTYTAPQLTAAAIAGTGIVTTFQSGLTTTTKAVAVADPTKATFTTYNDGTGGPGAWRCRVNLNPNDPAVPLIADFQLNTIIAAGDDAVTMYKRLFIAAKIQLGIS